MSKLKYKCRGHNPVEKNLNNFKLIEKKNRSLFEFRKKPAEKMWDDEKKRMKQSLL